MAEQVLPAERRAADHRFALLKEIGAGPSLVLYAEFVRFEDGDLRPLGRGENYCSRSETRCGI